MTDPLNECGTYLDHTVTIVGFSSLNEPTPYWIVKNSVGTTWGEEGYAKIAITEGDGICGINKQVAFPNLLLQPSSTVFWLFFATMTSAVFFVVPLSFWCLSKHKTTMDDTVGEVMSHKTLTKTLIFE